MEGHLLYGTLLDIFTKVVNHSSKGRSSFRRYTVLLGSQKDEAHSGKFGEIGVAGKERAGLRGIAHALSGVLAFVVMIGGYIAPLVGAAMLWDSHRGLAWAAIAGTLLGVLPYLGWPVGVGLIVFAVTGSGIAATIAAGVGLLVMVLTLTGLAQLEESKSSDGVSRGETKLSSPTYSTTTKQYDRFCRRCGSPVAPGVNFCRECGNRLRPPSP